MAAGGQLADIGFEAHGCQGDRQAECGHDATGDLMAAGTGNKLLMVINATKRSTNHGIGTLARPSPVRLRASRRHITGAALSASTRSVLLSHLFCVLCCPASMRLLGHGHKARSIIS